MTPVAMERFLVGYHLYIEACGFYSIWKSSSCMFKEERYTQWYEMEIIYHSLLTDKIDTSDDKFAT